MSDLRDIESDMSAIHRIDDMYSIPAPRFFALAYRLAAYRGTVTARIALNSIDETPGRKAAAGTDLTPDEVEALRHAHRVRTNPKALRQGEQPRRVSLEELLAQ